MASAWSFPTAWNPDLPHHHHNVCLGLAFAAGSAIALASLGPRRTSALLAAFPHPHPFLPARGAASFACLASSLPHHSPTSVTQPNTGVSFPIALHDGKQLAGIGLRKKSLFGLKNITVYAFGIYANELSLKDKIGSKYGHEAAADLKEAKAFYDDLVESDVDLTVRLIIVYGRLKIGSVRSAFEESIGNRIKKFSGSENRPLLESFTKLFREEIKLPKGTTIDITRNPGYVLQTKVDGMEIGSVQSPLLCRAFLDLYIGEEPFDTKAKEEIGVGLASFLSG